MKQTVEKNQTKLTPHSAENQIILACTPYLMWLCVTFLFHFVLFGVLSNALSVNSVSYFLRNARFGEIVLSFVYLFYNTYSYTLKLHFPL